MTPLAKTNAVRILDQRAIRYRLLSYTAETEHLDAVVVAERLGLAPKSVFKTLLARGDKHGPCFAVVPGPATLDLKALARASGDRRVELVALKDVTPLTGYVRGGVTALGAKKDFPVYLDESALACAEIGVSAGRRGLELMLSPAAYVAATRAKLVRLVTT
jgi:Cys-tRNA(Pro)/Cys-tRNA(Cys) deacylase